MKKQLNKQQVEIIIDKYHLRIGPWTLKDGLINVNGNVKICHTNLKKLPLKFGVVYGDFIVSSNQLTTLLGCPQYVAGDFNCSKNKITSLRYAPQEVFSFHCQENQLTSLEGSPKVIPGDFSCASNNLTSLLGAPNKVNGYYYGFNNKLTTLEGSPIFIGGSFRVEGNNLINLVGCPKEIGGIFGFDAATSLYMGDQDCKVHRIEIAQDRTLESKNVLPQVVIDNKKSLPVVFRYMHLLNDIFSPDGSFDEDQFSDLILDIKDGFC